jgi:hypothetical protein
MPLAAALIVVAMLLAGQSKASTDLNGTWKMIPDRSGSPEQTPPVNDMTLSVTSSSDEVRLEWLSGTDQPGVVIYPMVAMPKQPAGPLGADTKRAYWDGNHLVLERGGTINGQTVSLKQSLTLDPEHNELILERLVIVQHGYTLKGTQNYATVKDVFTRSQQ